MENIFEKINLRYNYFFNVNLEWDLLNYLDNNLYDETVRWNLRNTLTINANG